MITAIIATSVSHASELTTTSADQKNLNVTIYNSNVALIKDTRNVTFAEGRNTFAFKDVSASIQPETAILKGDKVSLLEQNFEYDLLSEQSLLDKYVGKTVTVEINNPATGEVTQEKATVLANNNGVVLKIGDSIRGLGYGMSIIYDDVPENLRDKPTLSMTVDNEGTENKNVELSYLSHNLNWKADYVANIVDDKTLNLKGWVTLTNNSGATYKDANLQLVAGEVNRVQQQEWFGVSQMDMSVKTKSSAPQNMSEESLFEYHLYTLEFPTTIKDKQQKQVSLLSANNVPYEKRLVVDARDHYGWRYWGGNAEYISQDVHAKLIIDNKKSNNLGIPMPAGVIRTYQNDSKGSMQFIGEDRIKHTPEKETVMLELGKSFDVTVKRKQTDFKQIDNIAASKSLQSKTSNKNRNITASYEIVLKNAKDKETTVDYLDNYFGNWKITQQSLNSVKINSQKNRWRVAVPAKGEVKLTYTVSIDY